MKVEASLGRRCKHCQAVRRKGIWRIICKVNPRHKMTTSTKKRA